MRSFLLATICASTFLPAGAASTPKPLADLIQAGDLDAAREQIRAGADVNLAQPNGTMPIHWAVYKVDYGMVEALIAKKAEVNVSNLFGATPLAEAAKLGDTRMVKLLLDAGANAEGANGDGETALMMAIKLGHLPVVEMLVNAGAKVNAVERMQNQTPLMWAVSASKNAPEMTKLLLAKGADVKPRALFSDWEAQVTSEPRAQFRPVGGLTALLYAARDGCYHCVAALLDAGADVNVPTPEGVTALMLAIDNDHPETAKLLLERDANPHVWDWWGRTALYIAVDRKVVAEVGAANVFNENTKSPPLGPPPPGVARATRLDVIHALLAKGVDPNVQVNFHRPSRSGNSGRFIDPLLSTGCTPLLRAAIGTDLPVMTALLEKGASPNIIGMGITPFLEVAGVGSGARLNPSREARMDAVKLLVEHGADVNAQVTDTRTYSMRIARALSTNEGMTALHVAAERGNVELVRYLLAHGAKPEALDAQGRKPAEMIDITLAKQKESAGTASDAGPTGPVERPKMTPEQAELIRELLAGPVRN